MYIVRFRCFFCFRQLTMSSSSKRKRSSEASALMAMRPYKTPYKKARRTYAPRAGGYYGRYADRAGELKFHDVELDDAVVSGTGTVTATINIIPQGVTEVQRIGRKCTLRNMGWRYSIELPESDAQATPPESDSVRMILFIDKQANGATATVTDLLETAAIQSFRNLANSGRFTFLCDKLHNMNYNNLASDGAGLVSAGRSRFEHTFFTKLDLPIEFSSTTGAIGEIRSNNLGVLLISSATVARFDSSIRIRFSDN